MTRLLPSILVAAVALTASADDASVALRYQRVLYPEGVAPRVNVLSGNTERPAFVLHAHAALPDSGRTVVVYSERFDKDMPLEKLHKVFAALLENGDEPRVLDRHELTADLPLSLDAPGHVLDLKALVTPLPAPNASIVAVELWASLHGTAGYNAANDLFFTVAATGKLEPVLTVNESFASARVDVTSSAGEMTRILFGTTPATAGEIVVDRRTVNWTSGAESKTVRVQCGPAQLTTHRFDGRTFQSAAAHAPAANGYAALPRLPILEKTSCN